MEPTGQIASGVIRLPYNDVISAMSYLERSDKTTLYVKKLSPFFSLLFQLAGLRLRKKITRPFQAEFFSNVSLMLRSGVTLTTALEEAASSSGRADFESDIRDMISNIEGGASFCQAAEKYPYIFPETVVHLIRIGEETGKLDRMLTDAAEHLKRMQTILSDTKQALLYPSFVFIALGAGLVFWFYYVVPQIVGLFTEMDVSLPPLTVFLIKLSDFVQNHFLSMIFGIAVLVLTTMLAYKGNRRIRKLADVILLKLPVSGTIISASTMAFITEYFSLLLNVGIDILQSLTILKDSVKNEVYREKLAEVRDELATGKGISESFGQTPLFPSFVVRMLNVGEQSGTLPEQLSHIAEDYRNKLSIIVATIGKIIEPVVLVIAGAMFAIIIGGLFLPIYDLVSQVSGR